MQAETIEAGADPRTQILKAAAECFMERGYASTSIDDVARRLGATKGRVYHHFHAKTELFAAIFQAGMDKCYASIQAPRSGEGSAFERLRKMAAAHARQVMISKPFQCVVWQGVELHLRGSTTPEQRDLLGRLIDYRDAYEQIFRDEVASARREGALRFDNLGVAVQLMFVALNSPIFWYKPRAGETGPDIDRLVAQTVDFAMCGLGAKED